MSPKSNQAISSALADGTKVSAYVAGQKRVEHFVSVGPPHREDRPLTGTAWIEELRDKMLVAGPAQAASGGR